MREADWTSPDGKIRLFNADCLSILPQLEAGSVDLVLTDPPYGHNNNSDDLISRRELALGTHTEKQETRPIANDGKEANQLFRDSLPMWFRLLGPGCCCCCCGGGGGPDPQFARWSLWLDEVFEFKQMVVWDKGPMGMGWHYRRSYETILVGMKPGAACRWFDDGADVENIIRPGKRATRKILPSADQHPTEKPVGLAEHFLRLHTDIGHTALDPFMGHAWAAVAAIRTERRFIGCEIDPYWFGRAIKRIEGELARFPLFSEFPDA